MGGGGGGEGGCCGGGGCWSLTAESAPPQPCSWTPTVMCFNICQTCQPPPFPPAPPPALPPPCVRVFPQYHKPAAAHLHRFLPGVDRKRKKKRRREEESEHFGALARVSDNGSQGCQKIHTSSRAPAPRPPPPTHTHTHTHYLPLRCLLARGRGVIGGNLASYRSGYRRSGVLLLYPRWTETDCGGSETRWGVGVLFSGVLDSSLSVTRFVCCTRKWFVCGGSKIQSLAK